MTDNVGGFRPLVPDDNCLHGRKLGRHCHRYFLRQIGHPAVDRGGGTQGLFLTTVWV